MVSTINQIIYSKQKMDVLSISVFFSALFQQHIFPIHLYRVAYKWRMDKITLKHELILISIDMWQYHKFTYMYSHQRSKVHVYVENHLFFIYFQTHAKRYGKHVKVKKRQSQNRIFCVFALTSENWLLTTKWEIVVKRLINLTKQILYRRRRAFMMMGKMAWCIV